MPYDGKLIAMDYIPGDLFSVNQKTVQSVDGLFARNERVVCYFETEFVDIVQISEQTIKLVRLKKLD
jgi:phosphatidylserine decarboxylase